MFAREAQLRFRVLEKQEFVALRWPSALFPARVVFKTHQGPIRVPISQRRNSSGPRPGETIRVPGLVVLTPRNSTLSVFAPTLHDPARFQRDWVSSRSFEGSLKLLDNCSRVFVLGSQILIVSSSVDGFIDELIFGDSRM